MSYVLTGISTSALSGIFAALCVAVLSSFVAGPAQAYQCKNSPHQAVGVRLLKNAASGASRQNWSTTAKAQYGLAWSVWAISKNKSVSCAKLNSGKWRCLASAKPCLYVAP